MIFEMMLYLFESVTYRGMITSRFPYGIIVA